MLKATDISKSFGTNSLLTDAELLLSTGDTAALVGVNGVGKSTFMAMLAGDDRDYHGEIAYGVKNPLIAKMNQEIKIEDDSHTIHVFIKNYTGVQAVEDEMNDLLEKDMTDGDIADQYSQVLETFERMGGREFDVCLGKTLSQLGLSQYNATTKSVGHLSGGEKNKVLLCATLLSGSDFLFLDEPTNNLDRAAVDGLVSFLTLSQATCLIVSHDKKFLNKVVSCVFEIVDEQITEYAGNYKSYMQAKRKEYLDQQDLYIKQQEEYVCMGQSKKNLQAKATHLANKGNTKDGDKGDGSSKVAKKLARQAKAIQSRVGQIDVVQKPQEAGLITLTMMPESVSTGSIHIDNLYFAYPESNFSLTIKELTIGPMDKILIQGDNGEGKSTFLRLLLGELSPEQGNIVVGSDLSLGYYAQHSQDLPVDYSPQDYLHSQGHYLEEDVNAALDHVGFSEGEMERKIGIISPGLKSKIVFALLSLQRNNVLVFDEPTNHVDLATTKQLEKIINTFNGIVVVVSHDQEFIRNLELTRSLKFEDGRCGKGNLKIKKTRVLV